MAKKRTYPKTIDTCESPRIYELVQLLRLNGAVILRAGHKRFSLKLSRNIRNMRSLSDVELVREFGPGTLAYLALRKHQRAGSIPRNKDLV